MAQRRTLADWLNYIERQHPKAIDLGLERVRAVLARLDVHRPPLVLAVGGTNGKGSTCAILDAILGAAGYRVGTYTSPHLQRYNERVRIAGEHAADERLCEAFARVEEVRQGEPLTYFEFGTLACLWLFAQASLDVWVLEVGLGGRLDAVNAVDADCAVLTSIGIDHTDWLGPTRDDIGREKAGLMRPGRPAVISDPDPPGTVLQAADALGVDLRLFGRDFGAVLEQTGWRYWSLEGFRAGLAYPAIRGGIQARNAAAAIHALEAIRAARVSMREVRLGLARARIRGRFEILPGRPRVILDVAHNAEAAAVLAENLAASGHAPRTIAVLGMLADKDLVGVVSKVRGQVSEWHLASLAGPRAASAADLARALDAAQAHGARFTYASAADAFLAARARATEDDKILVFGSFLTVGEVQSQIEGARA